MKKLLTIFLTSFLVCSLFAEPRNALLIANSRYKNFGSLSTPVNEAAQLKATLEKLDFNVQVVNNASREQIIDSLYDIIIKRWVRCRTNFLLLRASICGR